jgi:hypothetical protein
MRRDQDPALKSKSVWRAGAPAAIESESPRGDAALVLEDDGETGYLYAIDREQNARSIAGNRTYRIVNAVHLYNVTESLRKPQMVELIWTKDGRSGAAKIGGEIQAVIDFGARRSWCRSGFGNRPNESEGWSDSFTWEEAVIHRFAT